VLTAASTSVKIDPLHERTEAESPARLDMSDVRAEWSQRRSARVKERAWRGAGDPAINNDGPPDSSGHGLPVLPPVHIPPTSRRRLRRRRRRSWSWKGRWSTSWSGKRHLRGTRSSRSPGSGFRDAGSVSHSLSRRRGEDGRLAVRGSRFVNRDPGCVVRITSDAR
jgi:hypothetical protein